jgi:hypothetical protein
MPHGPADAARPSPPRKVFRGNRAALTLALSLSVALAGCSTIAGTPSASSPQSAGPAGTSPLSAGGSSPLSPGPAASSPGISVPATPSPLPDGPIAAALPADLAAPSDGWLVLVYQAAGNDLEEAILGDVREAMSATDPDVRVLSLLDRSPESGPAGQYTAADTLPGIPEGGGTQLVTIAAGRATLVADLPDQPMSAPETLAAFVGAGIRAYPAAKVALVIADHGGGWTGAAVDEVVQAAGGPAMLDLPAIVGGVRAGLATAGRERLDLIGFDACLMAEVDVASALAPFTDRLVASAQTEPGAGWDWTFLAGAAATDDPDQLATRIVDAYGAFYADIPAGADATLAVLDLSKLEELDTALGYLSAGVVVGGTAEDAVTLARARAIAWEYGRSPDPSSDSRLVDVGDWAALLADQDGPLADPARRLGEAVDDVVLTSWSGPQAPRSTGLSVYLPQSADAADPDYAAVASGSLWSQFLTDFHARVAAIEVPTPFTDPDAVTVETDGHGSFLAEAGYQPTTRGLIVGGRARLGALLDDGSIAYLAAAPVTVDDRRVSGGGELTFLYAGDGTSAVPVYLDQEQASTVPYWYRAPDGTVTPVVVRIGQDDGGAIRALSAAAVLAGAAPTRAVLDPAGTLVPRFITARPDGTGGWTGSQAGGVSADLSRHVYRFGQIPSGTEVAVQLAVQLANGTESAASTTVTVP